MTDAASSSLPPGVTVMTLRPLYSSGQVLGASLISGMMAGAWLLALNYRRLGAPRKARMALGLSFAACLVQLVVFWCVPALTLLGLIAPFVMFSVANALQGPAYRKHVALGGAVGSDWRVVGIGVANAVLMIGVAAACLGGYDYLQ